MQDQPIKKNNNLLKAAKMLRKNMTRHERHLWYDFLQKYPVKIYKQRIIDNYIADFYCAKARLVIELDGSEHYTPPQFRKDLIRTQKLSEMNVSVIRICNLWIDRNFQGVCEFIDQYVQKSLPQSALRTAPSSEGADPE